MENAFLAHKVTTLGIVIAPSAPPLAPTVKIQHTALRVRLVIILKNITALILVRITKSLMALSAIFALKTVRFVSLKLLYAKFVKQACIDLKGTVWRHARIPWCLT